MTEAEVHPDWCVCGHTEGCDADAPTTIEKAQAMYPDDDWYKCPNADRGCPYFARSFRGDDPLKHHVTYCEYDEDPRD